MTLDDLSHVPGRADDDRTSLGKGFEEGQRHPLSTRRQHEDVRLRELLSHPTAIELTEELDRTCGHQIPRGRHDVVGGVRALVPRAADHSQHHWSSREAAHPLQELRQALPSQETSYEEGDEGRALGQRLRPLRNLHPVPQRDRPAPSCEACQRGRCAVVLAHEVGAEHADGPERAPLQEPGPRDVVLEPEGLEPDDDGTAGRSRTDDLREGSKRWERGDPERVQPHDVGAVPMGGSREVEPIPEDRRHVLHVPVVRAPSRPSPRDDSDGFVTEVLHELDGLVGRRRDAASAEGTPRAHHEYLHGSSMAASPRPLRDVDAIVVSWNSEPHLRASLSRLPTWVRPIIVDNASSDGSVDVARSLGAVVVEQGENAGFPAAVNRALVEVEAPYVLLMNPDLVIAEDALIRCLDELEADPTIGVVGPATTHPNGRPEPAAARRDRTAAHVFVESLGLVHLSRRFDRQMVHDRRKTMDVDAVNGACMLLRTDLLRSLDGLDESVFMYLEDVDLCRRVRDAGYRVRFVADAPAQHQASSSTARGSTAEQARAYLHRIDAEVEFLRRYGRRGEAGLAVAAHVVRALLGCAVALVRRDRATRHRMALRYSLAQRGGRKPAPPV